MLGNLHVRFGVGAGVKLLGLHHRKLPLPLIAALSKFPTHAAANVADSLSFFQVLPPARQAKVSGGILPVRRPSRMNWAS